MNQAIPLNGIPRDMVSVQDYATQAKARLDENAWAYLDGGAADEISMRWNRQAFDEIALLPRVLRQVTGGHTRCELLGHTLNAPVLLAPIAWQKLFHPDGELATAYTSAAVGSGMVLSTLSSCSIEAVAQANQQGGDGLRWFQFYFQPEPSLNEELIRRAEAAGYQAIVFTVDAPLNGIRNREQRVGFALPEGIEAINLRRPLNPEDEAGWARRARSLASKREQRGLSAVFDDYMACAPSWDDLAWLVGMTHLPVIVKGILHPEDARQAIALGAAGLIVSNHGGRTLDTLPAPLDCLPAIAEATAGQVPLLLDGGIRRGTDIFKALALGAEAVLIGRAYIHALAVAGPLGIAHVLKILQDELEACMALCGVSTLKEISKHHLLFPSFRRNPV